MSNANLTLFLLLAILLVVILLLFGVRLSS